MMLFGSTVRSALSTAACSAFVLLTASVTHAASYGDFDAASVTYQSVQDESGLFGAPIIHGDTLSFSPTGLEAVCPGAPSCAEELYQIVDRIRFQIVPKPGFSFVRLTVAVIGETILSSGGLEVLATGFSRVFVDAPNVVTVGGAIDQRQFTTSEVGPLTYPWGISLPVDLTRDFSRATQLNINLLGSANAYAPGGGQAQARIQRIDVTTTMVPEPTTALLLGLGLAGLTSRRR